MGCTLICVTHLLTRMHASTHSLTHLLACITTSLLRVAKGGRGGCDPVLHRNFNQIHVSRFLETAEFTNHMSFPAIFTCHSLSFALFSHVMVKFLPFSCVIRKPFSTLSIAHHLFFKYILIFTRITIVSKFTPVLVLINCFLNCSHLVWYPVFKSAEKQGGGT